jgi:glutamate synthase (NADPH/NADH) large chain
MGMDRETLRRRLAEGAQVALRELDDEDAAHLERLLGEYERALLYSQQSEEARWLEQIRIECRARFVKIVALGTPEQPPVATE